MIRVKARRISVKGVVQGVGFRPFVYQLAHKHGLNGWVRNTSGEVAILVEGDAGNIDRFMEGLSSYPPPRSRIESVSSVEEKVQNYKKFEIVSSLARGDEYQLVSPDLATCPACQSEIFDPVNRRYNYSFTNCTQCGPRFTIIEDMPYDRSSTTMRNFKMCPLCEKEYYAPVNRRFHAQPNACPECGPRLELLDVSDWTLTSDDVIPRASQLLLKGYILAVKGLGGFLLACDAANDRSVSLLRDRKKRPAKPFAIMVENLEIARSICFISEPEEDLLSTPVAPIVLLRIKDDARISRQVAPGLKHLGVMLPYTPLHHLLVRTAGTPLVMTSGNLSEEPIAKDNREAVSRLSGIAEYFILHNRDISSRYDDSVAMIEKDSVQWVRRARGIAPSPVRLPQLNHSVLACGADLKNTFCLTRDNYAFVSQHIGDMENVETLEHFESTLQQYKNLFRIQPQIIACDMHPDYLSSRWAEDEAKKNKLPLFRIQHHHAHIASCLADNGVNGPVIGIAMDGTGYGLDGNIWGGEFLIADYRSFQRKAHFEYLPLPGGNLAVYRPYRAAIGYLYSLFGAEALSRDLACVKATDEGELELINKQVERGLNSPLTSSCGRLFDVVSSLLGKEQQVSYEGQAAMELEAIADDTELTRYYPYRLEGNNGIIVIRLADLFYALLSDLKSKIPVPIISAAFHNTLAHLIGDLSLQLSKETGLRDVALSGGVFQNRRLLNQVVTELRSSQLNPLLPRQVPCNDGGISLGQAVAASYMEGGN